jgi:hypothetical protein
VTVDYARPDDLETAVLPLWQLVACGGVRNNTPAACWLLRIGVAWPSDPPGWLIADLAWLRAALPATTETDLLRKAAVRDVAYRLHLDLLVGRVLSEVGHSGRWGRLTELLRGPLNGYAPRFVQLLETLSAATGRRAAELRELDWEGYGGQVEGNDRERFERWDRFLWGDVMGGPTALFPLLVEHYGSLVAHPVHVDSGAERMSAEEVHLLAELVRSATSQEGVLLDPALDAAANGLTRRGLPVRRWPSRPDAPDRRDLAGLVGPVQLAGPRARAESACDRGPMTGVDRGLLTRCRVLGPTDAARPLSEGLWSVATGFRAASCLGALVGGDDWPGEAELVEAPEGWRLPAARDFRAMDRPRTVSAEVDHALGLLGRHVVFGFWLQLLLIDALDRELGAETVVIALPPGRKEGVEPETRLFYTPASDSPGQRKDLPSYDLGGVEEVLPQLAEAVGVATVPLPRVDGRRGVWTAALRMFARAGLVTLDRARWGLVPEVLDRLHGGGLMAGVLRRGQDMRRRVHESLRSLWENARALSSAEEEGGHG